MKEKVKQEKSNDTKSESLAVLYTVLLIVLAFAVIIISSFLLPNVQMVGIRENDSRMMGVAEVARSPVADLNSYFTARLVLSLFNMLLASYLLFVYVRNYLILKSNFTLGIVAFLFSFLLYALSSIPLVHGFFGPFGIAGVFSFVPMLFSAIGLIIFAKLGSE
jgi:hypothetical protein